MYLDNVEYILYMGDIQLLPKRYNSFIQYLYNLNSHDITANIAWSIKKFVKDNVEDMGVVCRYQEVEEEELLWSFKVYMSIGSTIPTLFVLDAIE